MNSSVIIKNKKAKYDYSLLDSYTCGIVLTGNEIKSIRSSQASLNNSYLKDHSLNVEIMGRGMTWLDTGTFDSLHEAGTYIQLLERRQGLKVGCPEEVAWRMNWINDEELLRLAEPLRKSGYGRYLVKLLESF